jgi:hypothetical protein
MLTKAAREAKKLRLKEIESQGCLLVNRIEKYVVNLKDPNFLICDVLSETAKLLYNSVNYYCRHQWNAGQFPPSYLKLEATCKNPPKDLDYWKLHYDNLPAQTAQQVLIAVRTEPYDSGWSNQSFNTLYQESLAGIQVCLRNAQDEPGWEKWARNYLKGRIVKKTVI